MTNALRQPLLEALERLACQRRIVPRVSRLSDCLAAERYLALAPSSAGGVATVVRQPLRELVAVRKKKSASRFPPTACGA